MDVENITILTPPEIARRDKFLLWDGSAKKHALGNHACRNGWGGFSRSLGGDCEVYHAGFNLWILLGLVSSPGLHREHYEGAIRMATNSGEEHRILISAAATPELPEMVLNASGKNTRAIFLDICPTPLLACKDVFSCDQLARLELVQADILQYDAPDNSLDGIMTDAFLSRFKPGDQLKVLKKWARMLKPNGVVATTLRYGKKVDEAGYGSAQDQQIFVENVLTQARRLGVGPATLLELDTMVSLAKEYAGKMHSNHPESLEEVEALMKQAFRDVRIEPTEPYRFSDVTMRPYARITAYDPIKS